MSALAQSRHPDALNQCPLLGDSGRRSCRNGRTAINLNDPAERDRWHRMLAYIAAERGYKPGWMSEKEALAGIILAASFNRSAGSLLGDGDVIGP